MQAKDSDINDLPEIIPGLGDGEFAKYKLYFEILGQFNNKMNLVSQSTIHQAGRRHFADCHLGVDVFQEMIPRGDDVYDFGSGNGFPGIIFAVMRPDAKITLVERDRRKCEFLKHVAHSLDLSNVTVHVGNAKDIGVGVAKWGISRAMSPLPKMLLETREVMAPNGHLFLFKGEYWTGEFSAVPPQLFDYWDVDVKGGYQLANADVQKFILDCHRTDFK